MIIKIVILSTIPSLLIMSLFMVYLSHEYKKDTDWYINKLKELNDFRIKDLKKESKQ